MMDIEDARFEILKTLWLEEYNPSKNYNIDFQRGKMIGACMAFDIIYGREENMQASTIKSRENAEPEVEGEYTVTTRPIDAFSLARKVGESMVNNRHHEESLRLNHRLEHERFLKMIAREPTL